MDTRVFVYAFVCVFSVLCVVRMCVLGGAGGFSMY
jgi:hypothetical protein